jgi:NTE family protein
MAPRNSS